MIEMEGAVDEDAGIAPDYDKSTGLVCWRLYTAHIPGRPPHDPSPVLDADPETSGHIARALAHLAHVSQDAFEAAIPPSVVGWYAGLPADAKTWLRESATAVV